MIRSEHPEVSVVIPTLEEENYIATTLPRLVKVNPTVEIIVVDGGSRDRTVETAKRFTNNVYQIKEQGISKGRNYGAKQAKGDILVFLDADITFPMNFVDKVLRTFKDLTVVGATCNIMPGRFRLGITAFFTFYNFLIRVFTRFKPHSRGEFFAVRKSAFARVNGFNEDMPCLEDHELARRLGKLGRFVFISDLTVYESMRRFRKLGFWRVIKIWFMDYMSFIVRHKPISRIWQPVR